MTTSGFVFAFESIKTAITAIWNELSTINLGFPNFTVGVVLLVVFACYSTFRFLIFPALDIDFNLGYLEKAKNHIVFESKKKNWKRKSFY